MSISDTPKSIEEFDISDSNDDVEVVSDIDSQENELVDMSAYLRIGSSEKTDDNNDDPSASTVMIGGTCCRSDFENEDYPVDSSAEAGDSVTGSPFSLTISNTCRRWYNRCER